jgi:hypothetical protein
LDCDGRLEMNGLRCGPRGKEKFPTQAQNVAYCMGSLAREWANGPIFFLWKQFFWPRPQNGLVRGGALRERAVGSNFFLLGRFHVENNEGFPFLFSKF